MRNPRLVPLDEMRGKDAEEITLDANGNPTDTDAATRSGYATLARLIVGWHVWDASVMPELNAAGEDVSVPVLLPQAPVTAATVAKLPSVILTRLMEEMAAGINPPRTPASQEGTGSPS
jgi:hypothetical protein